MIRSNSNFIVQMIDFYQITFLKNALHFFDVFEFNNQLTFRTNSHKMFDVFAHVKSSLFDFDNVKHDCFNAMIINFVNMIQIIDTSSKFNVENSIVIDRISMMRDIIVVQLESIFVFFQLRISFQFI